MRILLVLLAALAVAGLGGWLLLRPPETVPAPVEVEGEPDPTKGPRPDPSREVQPAPTPAPAPVPKEPLRVPFVPAPEADHSATPGAVVPPLPEGDIEILRTDRKKDDQAKVDATRVKILETRMGEFDWQKVTLRDAVDRIAAKTGVPVEFEGNGLDAEVVTHKETFEVPALEVLRSVTGRARLRFEILADRVVVKR